MDENKNNNLELSQEEQNAEKEATVEVNDDELREKVIANYGLDPEEQKDLIDKIVADKKADHQKLSNVIRQKRTWREKAQSTNKEPDKGEGKKPNVETPDIDERIKAGVNAVMEERDLQSLDLPDDLKAEIKNLAKIKGISVREAANDPYIKYRVEEVERAKRIEAATPKRSNKGGYSLTIDPSKPLNPTDFKLDTPEGQKAWDEAKAAREKWKREH